MFLAESQSNLIYVILAIIMLLINVPISLLLLKIKKFLAFSLPVIFLVFAIFLAVFGFAEESWGRLIFLVYAIMAGICFVATTVSSSIVYIIIKKKEKRLINSDNI